MGVGYLQDPFSSRCNKYSFDSRSKGERQEVMNMKRSLILFSLIVFVTVSCAGPTKVGKLKALEKDWKECSESIDRNFNSEAFGKAFEECLEKKGYEYMSSKNIVSRTGPHVYFETSWMKSQDEYEKDRKECIESIDKNLNSEAFEKALEDCLEKKGYEFKILEKAGPSAGMIVLQIVLFPLVIAYGILLVGSAP